MKLIKDLGTKYATQNSKRKYRFGLYECPICKKEFQAISSSVNSKHTTKCRNCSSRNISKNIIEKFEFELSKDCINDLFYYKEGNLYYKKRISMRCKINDLVGSPNNLGYIKTKIKNKTYSVHRLIWIYHNGFTDLDRPYRS